MSMPDRSCAVLVDFGNFFPDHEIVEEADPTPSLVNDLVRLALDRYPDAAEVHIRLYGGWLDDGILTNAASALQASIESGRFFPRVVPLGKTLLRGSVILAYTLVDLPTQ